MLPRRPRGLRPPFAAWGALLCLVATGAVHGQELPTRPTIAEVESRLAGLPGASLEAAERGAAEAAYKQALESLRLADEWAARAADFVRLTEEAPGKLTAYRAELASPMPPLPDGQDALSATQLEQERAQAAGNLTVARELIEKLRAETSTRSDRQVNLPGNLARLREQVTGLEEGLRGAPPPEAEPARAEFVRAAAQRAALRAEITASEQELASYDARQELLQVRRDRAQRRLAIAEQALDYWQRRVDDQRRLDAERAALEADRLRQAALRSPQLRELAEGNQELATARTEANGWVDRLERAGRDLSEARAQLQELRDNFRALRRRERVAGLDQAMGAILRIRYAETLDPFRLRRAVWTTQGDLAKAEVASIEYGEQREGAGDVDAELGRLEAAGALDPAARAVALELIETRRDLLDAALLDTERLARLLSDLDFTRRELQRANSEFREYMEERILWVRSVQHPLVLQPKGAAALAQWLLSPTRWREALGASANDLLRTPLDLARVLLFVLLFGLAWGFARTTLSAPAQRVTIGLTLRKLLRSAFLGAPPAGLVILAAWLLTRPPAQVQPAVAVGAALQHLAAGLFVGWLLYSLLQKKGVGSDLRWPSSVRDFLRRHLRWFVPLKVLCAATVTGFDQQPTAEWSDSIGRLAFCAGEVVLLAFLYWTLRASSPVVQSLRERSPNGIALRLRPLWYPLAVGLPLLLLGLCLGGYFYTATHLERRLLMSLLAVVVLAVAYGISLRWLLLARRRLAQQQIANLPPPPPAEPAAPPPEAPQAAEPADGDEVEPLPSTEADPQPSVEASQTQGAPEGASDSVEAPAAPRPASVPPTREGEQSTSLERDDALDLALIREQTGRLFRSLAVVALIVALWLIWDDVLPALKRLEQVQLWPTVDWVEAEEQHYPALERTVVPSAEGATPGAPADHAPTQPAPEGDDVRPVPQLTPVPALAPAPSEPDEAAAARVTLVHLGTALIVFAFTLLVARNLPGLLELALFQRLPLDAGARYALITVTRYAVVFFGVTLAFRNVGIGWSSIQWLAAALTFGLAFGLQEIFANFVSGLILLAERPIRVGDVVTVSGINGKVARIRIRATTILQWNGKELVIPNKNFVTGDVVNWTLSDPSTRLDIPLGVAYGSDVPKVKRLLLELTRAHPLSLADPPPAAYFMGFGDSVLSIELRVWIPDPNAIPIIRDDLLNAIQERFAAEDVEIAFPQRDLHVRSGALDVRLVEPERAPKPPGGA
ncbi:MAG: mechanosensitive ion channel [Planctomycetes bacterium]|nr:mechanosensitive ion channel [Planctomycetota bacterium]